MCLQVTFGAEALATDAAAKWLLTSVREHVGVQPSYLPEGFSTDTTLEGLFASVDPLVYFEYMDRGQAFATGVTGHAVGRFVPGVVPDVHCQSAIIDESLPTELTDVRPLTAVDPLVAPQSTGSWEAFPADAAAVRFDTCVAAHVGVNVLVGFATDVADLPGVSVSLEVVQQHL